MRHLFSQQKQPFASHTLKILSIAIFLALTLCNTTQPALATSHKPNSATNAFTANIPTTAQKGFARAQVSVVRLHTTFKVSEQGKPDATATCTGLGVLIASDDGDVAKRTPSTLWVLTDSSLVSGWCLANHTPITLASAKIYFNTAYTGDAQTIPASLVNDSPAAPICTDDNKCAPNQAAFLSFQGTASPFLALTPSSSSQTSMRALVLKQKIASGVTAPVLADEQQVKQFLTPQLLDSYTDLEPGTPFIDAEGNLAGMRSTDGKNFDGGTIQTFIRSLAPEALSATANRSNQVDTHWDAGIDAFYKQPTPDYQTALTEFDKAAQANTAFKGGQAFIPEAKSKLASANGTPTASVTPLSSEGESFFALPLWQASILLLVVLIIIVVVGGLVFRSRIRKRQQFQAHLKQLEHRAESNARRVREEEAQRAQAQYLADRPTVPVNPLSLQATAAGNQQIYCPSCKASIPGNANYCPRCHRLLSPLVSGISTCPASQSPVYSPSAATTSVSSVSEQPTRPQLPPPDDSEYATVKLLPKTVKLSEKLALESRRLMLGRPLGFIVGSKSDPGIKRRYKPNEDSFLATQGLISAPSPQPFGLFVVADGIGERANGQDASRQAIQSIVDNIPPKLVAGNAEIVDYAQVIKDGIQSANQAVYQHNKQQRVGMGTTVTAALIVGDTAYVANVGDSRTYHYHESKLCKVTKDHSVVASLVDAGIIKYDDIYTHPKRNQIYRSLGEKENVEIDVFTVKLHEGDKLLLCSDGLWDMVRDPRIEELIKRPVSNPSQTCDDLIQSALKGGGEDNVSVIVVQLTSSKNANPPPAAFDPTDIRADLNTDVLAKFGTDQKSQNHPLNMQKQL